MFAAKTDIPCMFMDIPYILYERGAAPLRKISIDVSSTYSRHILSLNNINIYVKIYAQIFSLLLLPLEMGFPCYLPVPLARCTHGCGGGCRARACRMPSGLCIRNLG